MRQIGYLQGSHQDARSTKHKIMLVLCGHNAEISVLKHVIMFARVEGLIYLLLQDSSTTI